MEAQSIIETLSNMITQLITWTGEVFKTISGNELALLLVCLPVGFTVVRFAKYLLGI